MFCTYLWWYVVGISDDGGAFKMFMKVIHILTHPSKHKTHSKQKLNEMTLSNPCLTFKGIVHPKLKALQKCQGFPGQLIYISQIFYSTGVIFSYIYIYIYIYTHTHTHIYIHMYKCASPKIWISWKMCNCIPGRRSINGCPLHRACVHGLCVHFGWVKCRARIRSRHLKCFFYIYLYTYTQFQQSQISVFYVLFSC